MGVLQEIVDEFADLTTQRERLQVMIALGKELEGEVEKTPSHKVVGCMSDVYISSTEQDGKVYYTGWADSLIVKGYVVILIKALNGKTKEEILASDSTIEEFIVQAHLNESLVPTRANAFSNIFKHMKKIID